MPRHVSTFTAQSLLGVGTIPMVDYRRAEVIFSPGDPGDSVMYIQRGGVKLSVRSKTGREAVVAILGPGEFFGEGCLAGQADRTRSATAITPATILAIEKDSMIRLLRRKRALADRFISHMLARNIRVEEDLIDQLFSSSETRLAQALLLLARYGKQEKPRRVLRNVSHATLAAMAGTTRARVAVLMTKFEKSGFIENNGGLTINRSLLSVVLRD
jgi:CRP/FNR family transcriptional regulator, cyclic AMP receptor protein